uniref:Cas scaffold protein family member 4 n=1 Tax=Mastacembelus armatus TaxID=205130 RepID=A0A3Q3NMP9_9TELE
MKCKRRSLYDNTAECADELAFRKGDIVMVIDQNVAGTSGWWMCSLYGRHGLAPANRLQLLPQTVTSPRSLCHATERSKLIDTETDDSMQNIYQIPSVPRLSSSPAYERMDMIYKVPSIPLSASKSPAPSEGHVGNKASTTPRRMSQKHSLISSLDLEKRFDSPKSLRCSSPGDSYVYAVPPSLPQDPNYDIPVPSATEAQTKVNGGYSTLPNPYKSEWIYDVPVSPEKQGSPQGSHKTMPSKAICRPLYDTLPAHARVQIYDKPPPQTLPKESIYDVPAQEELSAQVLSHPPSDHTPLECRGDSNNAHERVRLQRIINFMACTSFHDLTGTGESLVQEKSKTGRILCHTAADSQRSSTASSSSTSSCDSLALSSSSPEPLREVTLTQEEACRRLLDLQESVCKAVPKLMEFVSSHWRSKEHLKKHLNEIKQAAEGIACSLSCFLNFALDVKGNAHRLTDANLQTRLYKQLSIVEDSGVILHQTMSALNTAGWPLNTLSQDPGQVQTPDQLERFVMVARTVPEDVKRLVSIINANGKLLFRALQKDPEAVNTTGQLEAKKSPNRSEQGDDLVEDDNDYVELQVKITNLLICILSNIYALDFLQNKNEIEKQQKEVQREAKEDVTPFSNKALADNRRQSSTSTGEHESASLSEHCRLYFGALQKAIAGFVGSLQAGQPPEKFISQSKLVIMVGQRLVDTLCREAQRAGSSQSLLCKSNHLCALLKQLAVATKKAALHFPDKQALHEVQEFAKELAQRAQHFRITLEL